MNTGITWDKNAMLEASKNVKTKKEELTDIMNALKDAINNFEGWIGNDKDLFVQMYGFLKRDFDQNVISIENFCNEIEKTADEQAVKTQETAKTAGGLFN